MAHRFYMVDVFAEHPYSGNPLAVVVGSEPLSGDTMQRLAAEINFSETTFVTSTPEEDGAYRVRIFTPAREIDFTGHPILGTAWVIRHYVARDDSRQIQLSLAVGKVPVTFEISDDGKEHVWFLAPEMSLGAISTPKLLATTLGLSSDDIETATPIQVVSAGTSALMVPLKSLDALRRSKLTFGEFSMLVEKGFPALIYLFCRQTHLPQNDLCVRFFFDAHGVREDPATGNGAAFLGAYSLEYQLFSDTDWPIRIEQGYEIRRPSLVMLRTRKCDGNREVSVGGYVIPTVRGELL
ncbi:MAG TPA: PhzF family phenazine biosynthesis protein [Gammaproteobacteria bacterium]|nr:PhzF family phenazine biosynthesis protein [Gammaproteobacteria bacterium]